jgi:hypothetical protein
MTHREHDYSKEHMRQILILMTLGNGTIGGPSLKYISNGGRRALYQPYMSPNLRHQRHSVMAQHSQMTFILT